MRYCLHVNTDKNDSDRSSNFEDPTIRGNANFCYTIRMFKLSDSGNYVFRGSHGVSSFLTTLMLQGQTLPELEGLPTAHELKKHLDDCLFKRIDYRVGTKFGYYLRHEDFSEFLTVLSEARTRIRVVVFSQDTMAGHVESGPISDDYARERDVKVGKSLLTIDRIFQTERKRAQFKELERIAKATSTPIDTTSIQDTEYDLARTQIDIREVLVDAADPKSSKIYVLRSVPGVDMQFVLTDMDSAGYSRDGETYQAKRAHLPKASLHRRVSFLPSVKDHKSSYVFPEACLEKLVWEFNTKYCLVQLMLHKLDGTVEELTDSGKTEDWALEDMIPDQRATYNKYLEGRKALQEELKAAREKSTPKPVA